MTDASPTIMIVEDEWAIAEDLKQCLQRMGYAVSSIEDTGEGAVASAERDRPDLVLMDIVLKGAMSGIEAAGEIQKNLSIPHVFLTAYSGKKVLDEARLTKSFGYLLKPFDEKELQATIEMALYRHAFDLELRKQHQLLQEARDQLEDTVRERTEKLEKTNRELAGLVREHEKALLALEERNITLKVLLQQREGDRGDMEQNILSNIKSLVLPYIRKLKKNKSMADAHPYLEIIEANLSEITSPFAKELSSRHVNLTPQEIKVAGLIKEGKRDKDIMEMLNVSFETIKTHRQNIRKKLGIYGKRTNLRSYLQTTL